MFPITYKNRFIYTVQGDPSWAADDLHEYLAQSLIRERARNVTVDGKQIRFDGRIWTFDLVKWRFLHGISKGKITVDFRDKRVGVVYQISFIDYFVIFFVMLVWWVLVLFGSIGMQLSVALEMLVIFSCWFGLFYVGSIALNCYRFNRFMKNRLREFFNSAANSDMHGELIASR